MALAGNINPYVPGNDFDFYEDRIKQFFLVNNVEKEKETALFITIAGEDMYEMLKKLTTPDKPRTKSYDELIKLVKKHLTPKRNKRAERYKFYKASQEVGESLSEFIIRLKPLSQTCEFGDFLVTEKGDQIASFKLKILDEALTDRFIAGLRNEKIKQHLFGNESSDFEKCCQKALQFEMVEKESKVKSDSNVNAIRNRNRSRSVNRSGEKTPYSKVNSGSQSKSNFACKRCGKKHDEKSCPAREWKCYKCLKNVSVEYEPRRKQ